MANITPPTIPGQQIPAPLPEVESQRPGNAIHGFVPGQVSDAAKGNLGFAGLKPSEVRAGDASYTPFTRLRRGGR